MDELLKLLSFAGNVLDTPGSVARGLLAGEPGKAFGGILDPDERVSGRSLLEKWGALEPKQEGEGFGLGDLAGMGTELATDPINALMGFGLGKQLLKAGRYGKEMEAFAGATKAAEATNTARESALAANAAREKLLGSGGMPEEIAKATQAVDASGKPTKLYHGTTRVFDKFDTRAASPNSLYGQGIYMTDDPLIAGGYADSVADSPFGKNAPHIRTHYLDTRKPLDLDALRASPNIADSVTRSGHPEPLVSHVLRDVAQQMGIESDAFTHVGGKITGSPAHRVWITEHPSNIYNPWIIPSLQDVPPQALLPTKPIDPRMRTLLLAATMGEHNALARQGDSQ